MGTCPSKPGKLNGSNVDNFVMADKGSSAAKKENTVVPANKGTPTAPKITQANEATNALPQTNVKYNKNLRVVSTSAEPTNKNVEYNKNLKVVSTSAEPTNKNVKYNKNLEIVNSEPKGNDNPKPVEKEEKGEKGETVQNGPTMVGGKRKHRKTQRKSKKSRSSRK